MSGCSWSGDACEWEMKEVGGTACGWFLVHLGFVIFFPGRFVVA